MRNSKLIRYLKKIDKKELKPLLLFVQSPFFNKRKEVTFLLEYLLGQYPHFEESRIEKAYVFNLIYPKAPYSDKQMRYLITYLNQLIEDFFVVNRIQILRGQKDVLLLEEYIERYPMTKDFQQRFKAIEEKLQSANKHGEAQYELSHKLYGLADTQFQLQRERKDDINLQRSSDLLDYYYILKKLKYSCRMLNRSRILSGGYELRFIEDIQRWAKFEFFSDVPLIIIYCQILQMLLEDFDIKDFRKLKGLLKQHEPTIDRKELEEIYQYGINFCLGRLRKGEDSFIKEALDLYIEGIENGIFLNNNLLSPWTFTNVVKLAIRSAKVDWAYHFIEKYGKMLPATSKNNVIQYNLAEVYFYKKDYDNALNALREVSFFDITFHLGSRIILAKTYYEKKLSEPLLSLLASFAIFLKRNKKISQEVKETYLFFCSILKKIILTDKPTKIKDLRAQITEAPLLTDRQWLISILDEKAKKH